MATDLSAPAFTLDVRVATTAMVGLRYSVDGRRTDIDDLVDRLEAAHTNAAAQRDDIAVRLAPYDAHHRGLVERLAGGAPDQYRQRLEEALALRTELARLEEQMACLRERIDALVDQRGTLRTLSASLSGISGLDGATIDAPGAAANQAVRQLFHLIDVDHQSVVQEIFEGPMQHLVEAALQSELLDRAVGGDHATAVEGAASCRRSTDLAYRELERLVSVLHPEELSSGGLVPSLRRLVADREAEDAVRIVVLGPPRRLSPRVEVALFRIVQEALANALAHGRAARVEVAVLFQPRRVSLVVLDDGDGFDVTATEARLGRSDGLGLITMRERAVIESGQLEVRSVVGQGTEVRASFDTVP